MGWDGSSVWFKCPISILFFWASFNILERRQSSMPGGALGRIFVTKGVVVVSRASWT